MKNPIVLTALLLTLFLTSCRTKDAHAQDAPSQTPAAEKYEQVAQSFDEKIERTEDEWKSILSADEYRVLRKQGTERSFTGDLLNNKAEGQYVCGGCGLVLFDSETKFKSGTGWPSFYQPAKAEHVGEITDTSHGMTRVEVVCNRCDGHLGHVFKDGPKPTGLRYCINSVSLDFVANEEAEEEKPVFHDQSVEEK